jgi:hypothetical protein
VDNWGVLGESGLFTRIDNIAAKVSALCARKLSQHSSCLVLVLGIVVFHLSFGSLAFAASGEQIFDDAACTLLDAVLTANFGAMITVIAGALAILASVMGSFKGAWALLFVSVGCFIYPELVKVLFSGLSC